MMRTLTRMGIVLAAACALSACNHAKDEAQVAKDTNAAQQKAGERVAEAERTAEQKEGDARKEVRNEQRDAAHVTAVQEEKVAESEAEGAHKVALARCEALSGAAQKSCRDQADAQYDVAKAKAKQSRAQSDPKP